VKYHFLIFTVLFSICFSFSSEIQTTEIQKETSPNAKALIKKELYLGAVKRGAVIKKDLIIDAEIKEYSVGCDCIQLIPINKGLKIVLDTDGYDGRVQQIMYLKTIGDTYQYLLIADVEG